MKNRKTAQTDGLHEIKNKKRPEAVKDKKGLHLGRRRSRRITKAIAALSVAFILVFGFSVGSAFFKEADRNTVSMGYSSVMTPVEDGEVYSTGAGYTGIEIFARLNWTFAQQTKWYGEMHGVVNTVVTQEVTTYKQYNDGILISADLTRSSLISGASQFCYHKQKDRVLWRKPVGGGSTYDGLNTEWQTGAPYRSMTISGENGFIAQNGLPAYELSVYVIEENTVLEASEVTREDGLYKITYVLNPENWQEEDENGNLITKGATAYYQNQMIFTGGLPEAPVFSALSVSFTFDENWQVFRTDVEEAYSAKYGPIAAPCTSTSATVFEYNTDKANTTAYEDYFKQYIDGETSSEPMEKEVTALTCLAEAFGSVLTEPTTLNLDLSVNGEKVGGIVNLDLSKTDFSDLDLALISAKAKIGAFSLWLEKGTAYLNYGGVKVSVNINDLITLIGDITTPEAASEGESEDLLAALANGEFICADGRAELHSVLPLLGLEIPVNFYFYLDENNNASLDRVTTEFAVTDDLTIGAMVYFGDEQLPALAEGERTAYAELVPYAETLIDLFTSETLRADVSYEGEGFAVSGSLDISLKELAVRGAITVDVNAQGVVATKTVLLGFDGETVYLDLDGVKLKAGVEDAVALITKYVSLPEISDGLSVDLGGLILNILSPEFAANFETAKEDNALRIALKGTELLQAFGLDFALGDVDLRIEKGKLSAALLGAELSVTKGKAFSVDTEGYADILPYAEALIDLFTNEYLAVNLSYAADNFTARAHLLLGLSEFKVKGEVTLSYRKVEKTLAVLYVGDTVYLDLEGIRLKAAVEDVVALVSEWMELPEGDTDVTEILNAVLGLNFGEILSVGEADSVLTVLLHGTELLEALGVDFALGDVTLSIEAGRLAVSALGAEIEILPGTAFKCDTEGYIDIVKYARFVADMVKEGYLNASVKYAGGKLSVEGGVQLSLSPLAAKAELVLSYGKIEKALGVIYKDGAVYLELEGIKLYASIDDAVGLVKQFVEIPETDFEASALIEDILSLDFTLTEADDTLSLTLAGNKLLEALGVEFDLGEVKLTLSESELTVSALGAELAVSAGEAFACDTEGYIDIIKYATAVLDLIEGNYLAASVSYAGGGLTVNGIVNLSLSPLAAQAELTLTYGKVQKTVTVIYTEGAVYLSLEGIRLYATLEDAIGLVKEFVEIPETDFEAESLIEDILSLDFSELLTLTEADDTLSLTLAGNKLLEALGVEFDLGEVKLTVSESGITVSALGAELALSAGDAFECDTEGYIDIIKYARTVAQLIEGNYLAAAVKYASGKLSVEGEVQLSLSPFAVQAEFVLAYGSVEKVLGVLYADGAVYLSLEGIKVSASISEAVGLVKQFVEIPESDFNATALIEDILSMNFEELLTLSEADGTLSLTLAGNKLLEVLGVEFDLGEVKLTVSESEITVNALGADISVMAGRAFTASTAGYINIVKYASAVLDLIEGNYLTAHVSYTGGELSVNGTVNLSLEPLAAEAVLTLTYGSIQKTVGLIYAGGGIYLSLEGVKLKLNVGEAVRLVKDLMNVEAEEGEESEESEEGDLIEKLLSLNFEELLALSEEEDTLSLALKGNALLAALGVDFELGDVKLTVSESEITVSALGAFLTIKSGDEFESDTEGYFDATPALERVLEIISAKAVSLVGDIALSFGDTEIGLSVTKGVLSWENGFALYLEATLSVLGTEHDIVLSVDSEKAAFAYGTVGAELAFEELGGLEKAFVKVYDRVRGIVGKALEEGSENPLPEIESISDLLALLKGGSAASGALDELMGGFDWQELVNSIELGGTNLPENIILSVIYGALRVDVKSELSDGFLALVLGYGSETLNLEASFHADVYTGTFPEKPAIAYLTAPDFEDLLDYVGAAAALIEERNLNFSLAGQICSQEEKYSATGGVKYDLKATINYYSGASFPFHIDTNGKTIRVNNDLYLKLSFALAARHTDDRSVYLDLLVLDAAPNGKTDGVLDFYISVSYYPTSDSRYKPLTFYAPAGEVMTLVSSVCVMFDLDVDILNDYLISKWISGTETVQQLKGLGVSIRSMIGDLLGSKQSVSTFAVNNAPRGFVKAITRGENTFSVTLNSEAIYGEKCADIVFSVGKTQRADGNSVLSFLSVENVRSGKQSATVRLDVNRNAVSKSTRPSVTYNFDGIDSLILSLAKSATHIDGEIISGEEKVHTYTLNRNFFINGKIKLSALSIVNANVNLVGISVNIDEEGKVGINIRLTYEAVKVTDLFVAIKGNSTVDITIKDGMVYMRREQTTDVDKKPLATPEILYRATPLDRFLGDIFDHLIFVFNFGDYITEKIQKSDGSGSTLAEDADLGTAVAYYLKNFQYTSDASGKKWEVTLNGTSLTGGVLGDIGITIETDGADIIRTLHLDAKLYSIITLTGDLTWQNPQGKMNAGIKDGTVDIQKPLEEGMKKALAKPDWEARHFLEGWFTSIYYRLPDSTLVSEQNVVIDSVTGEMLADPDYPDLSGYPIEDGYFYAWEKPSKFTPNMTVSAKAYGKNYTLIFVSEYEIEGYTYMQSGEYAGKWVLTVEWTYDAEHPLRLPFGQNERKRVEYFKHPHDDSHIHARDELQMHYFDQPVIVFEAVWTDIEYKATFTSDGKTYDVKTGNYGDEISLPETDPVKTGYDFDGWYLDGRKLSAGEKITLTGNVMITARFTPKQYTITLVSDHAITWNGLTFTLQGDGEYAGKYVATFTFTYDSVTELPSEVRLSELSLFLDGFVFEEGGMVYTFMPNVTEDSVLFAQWGEIAYEVRFVQESGKYVTQNYHAGDTLKNLPKVDEKPGYTGEWDIPEGFTVYPSDTPIEIRAKYTGIVYIITEFSKFEAAGFNYVNEPYEVGGASGNGYWLRIGSYQYGSGGKALGEGVHVNGYEFDYYYTGLFGTGERLTRITDDVIANIFGYNVGDGATLSERNVIYANWISNYSNVRLYSDIRFTTSQGYVTGKGYYYDYSRYKEVGYALNFTPVPSSGEFRQLGWWYNDPVSGWRMVSNIGEFIGMSGVELHAMWLQGIDVTITSLYTSSMVGGKQYNIGGTMTGGIPNAGFSREIYEAVGMSRTVTGIFVLHGGGDSDKLGFGKETQITEDVQSGTYTFLGTGLNSWTFRDIWPASAATHGGIVIQVQFEYNGTTITMLDGQVQSFKTYTVRYHDRGGDVIASVDGVSTNCEATYNSAFFDGKFDFSSVPGGILELDSSIYADTLAAKNGIEVPEAREGYTASWPHTPITEGYLDVYPTDTANRYDVVFVSTVSVPEFTYIERSTIGNVTYSDVWIYETTMAYESVVAFYRLGVAFGETYQVGLTDNVFRLPEIPKLGGKAGRWDDPSVNIRGARFDVLYDLDTVTYNSAVSFTYEGGGDHIFSTQSVQYWENSELITPEAVGTTHSYTFLGWYEQLQNGSWKKWDSVTVTEDGSLQVTLEALWLQEIEITSFATERTESGLITKSYKYETGAKFTGGKLVGGMVDGNVSSTAMTVALTLTNASGGEVIEADSKSYVEVVESYSSEQNYKNGIGKNYKRARSSITVTVVFETAFGRFVSTDTAVDDNIDEIPD